LPQPDDPQQVELLFTSSDPGAAVMITIIWSPGPPVRVSQSTTMSPVSLMCKAFRLVRSSPAVPSFQRRANSGEVVVSRLISWGISGSSG